MKIVIRFKFYYIYIRIKDEIIGNYRNIGTSILRMYRKYQMIFFHKYRWSENYLKFLLYYIVLKFKYYIYIYIY